MCGAVGHAEVVEHVQREGAPLAHRNAPGDERGLDVLLSGQRRDQVEGLEDEAERRGAQGCELSLRKLREVPALEEDPPRRRPVEAAEQEKERRLPLACRPWTARNSPSPTVRSTPSRACTSVGPRLNVLRTSISSYIALLSSPLGWISQRSAMRPPAGGAPPARRRTRRPRARRPRRVPARSRSCAPAAEP